MMKTLIKYIGLLIYSGLILPFYNTPRLGAGGGCVNRIIKIRVASSALPEVSPVCRNLAGSDKTSGSFSFFEAVAADLFPVLKNLK